MIIHLLGKGPVYETILKYNGPLVIPVERPCSGDILICSGYPYTIRKRTIKAYKHVINIHTSLLPKYRGRHPVDWAMENMEKEIGITIHYIQDETIDTGDIILQDSIRYNGEGYNVVMKRICEKVPDMLYWATRQIFRNCVYRRKQDERLATYYPRRTKPRVY